MKKIALLLMLVFVFSRSNGQQLMAKTIKHAFSNSQKQDVFKLTLTGKSILKGTITFQIIDVTGKEIFTEHFPSDDLLFDEADVLTPKQQVDSIKKRFGNFFNYPGFKKPAIAISEQYAYDNGDKTNWMDIKSDRSAIGFIYAHGYESSYGIAWSKKRKIVVSYFYSD